MTLMFNGNADFFVKFFDRCIKANLTTEKDKVDLLIKMAKESGQCSVSETGRSKEEIIKDLRKTHGRVLDGTVSKNHKHLLERDAEASDSHREVFKCTDPQCFYVEEEYQDSTP